jgi:N-acyl-D-amino-acid deacylase
MVKSFTIACVIAALILLPEFSIANSFRTAPEYDLVIINGRIVDGTGNPWFYGSVAIKGDRIAQVGWVDPQRAASIIDARGNIVSPGFIDVHTHIEGGISAVPTADNFVHMGVTTVVTGNCGSSTTQVGEFLSKLEQSGISINVATLIGHNSVRQAVMKEDNRAPTPEELEKMREIVDRAMREGAVGFSTGLIYVPGTYAKTEEIIELAKVAARYHGIYATHMRDEANRVTEAIREALIVGEQAKLPVEISHFKVSSKSKWGASRITCQMITEARARGQQVTVDQYVYTASSTSLNTLLPSWALDGGREKAKQRLETAETRAKIKRAMIDSIRKSGFKDFSFAVVSSYQPDPSYEGKSITEITKMVRGRTGPEEEAEQIINMYLAGSAGMVFHRMHEMDVQRILVQPFTMFASDSGVIRMNRGVPHPRGYGNNARVLGLYVHEKKLIGLEEAVRKMTSLPAATFGLWDRGLIRPGMAADIVIFDEEKVRDLATFDKPHQYAEGFNYVVVNGKLVISASQHTGAKPGRALYGPGKAKPTDVEPSAQTRREHLAIAPYYLSESMNSRRAALNLSGFSIFERWPAPSMMHNFEFCMLPSMASASAGGVSLSSLPTIMSTGQVIFASRGVESGLSAMPS